MTSSKKWVVISLCIVFISGLFAGIIIEREFLHRHHGPGQEAHKKFSRKQTLDRLSMELSLNPGQKQAIGAIFKKHKPEFDAIHKQVRSDLNALVDTIDKEVSNVLNDEQKKKFQKIVEHRKYERRPQGRDHDEPER
jgi:Spy/CpxP family protein refolding chaperone